MQLPSTPALATDCVVFNAEGQLLLVRRAKDPFKGAYALPGGFVDVGEEVELACRRELVEETGVEVTDEALILIGVYSNPERDPRGHTVSIAYLFIVENAEAVSGDDATTAEWVSRFGGLELAFDHKKIVGDALEMLMATRRSGSPIH